MKSPKFYFRVGGVIEQHRETFRWQLQPVATIRDSRPGIAFYQIKSLIVSPVENSTEKNGMSLKSFYSSVWYPGPSTWTSGKLFAAVSNLLIPPETSQHLWHGTAGCRPTEDFSSHLNKIPNLYDGKAGKDSPQRPERTPQPLTGAQGLSVPSLLSTTPSQQAYRLGLSLPISFKPIEMIYISYFILSSISACSSRRGSTIFWDHFRRLFYNAPNPGSQV